ncbi:hypothetical protein WKH56_20870 [Priestia sp. SB1]|uniref:hypothetical protein n=1 Tax=Priestia sp. SB1 TaxID=3132359 RepID=UPI0031705EBB
MAIVEGQKVKVKWASANKKHYIALGYNYDKIGQEFEVSISDLMKSSEVHVYFKCDNCNKKFIRAYRKHKLPHHFCSKECSNEFITGKPNPKNNKKEKTSCHTCKKVLFLPPYRLKDSDKHFCDKKCYGAWRKTDEFKETSKKRTTIDKVDVNCDECGVGFKKFPYEIRYTKNYCSQECNMKALKKRNPNPTKDKIKLNCKNCNEDFLVHESHSKGDNKFCSHKCYSEFRSVYYVGEKNPSFNSVKKECLCCNKEIDVPQHKLEINKFFFCSSECYQKKRWEVVEYNFAKTKIHLKVCEILTNMQISYVEEKMFNYYSVDIYLPEQNLAIEVMGDYWHAHPYKYSKEKLHESQSNNVTRDKAKNTYLTKNCGVEVLYLWESDINNNIGLCEKLISDFISKKESLINKHSFNYNLENEEIKLKNNVLTFIK